MTNDVQAGAVTVSTGPCGTLESRTGTTRGGGLWQPYPVYPAPGGVLQWASTEQADQFYWLTDGPDPDEWPVLVKEDLPDSWVRFDGGTGEFVHRLLTDPDHPFSTARWFDVHWYQSYGSGTGS